MTSSSFVRVYLWCQSPLTLLFCCRFASSGPAAGNRDPNADNDNGPNNASTVGEPLYDRPRREPLEHSVSDFLGALLLVHIIMIHGTDLYYSRLLELWPLLGVKPLLMLHELAPRLLHLV
jgi:hypothetical protein